ncbi:MAG: UDP-N-acetylmuramate dehydrogenase [Acidimicrobiia bacterium]|nr:UDP-N-acetylmuramate dehydrogenase [Acidimicrobiia bacterium]
MTALEALATKLAGRVERDVPLGPLTTYRVGGPAALAVRLEDERTLGEVLAAVRAEHVPILVVGKGSNLLVSDVGFPGLAVVLGEAFADVEIVGTSVRAGGAASLPVVARRTAAEGLTGFEWAVGVPGSVGGAVRMNAGGHGSDMAASLRRVRVADLELGEDGEMTVAELDLGYRRSAIRRAQIVLRADLDLVAGDRAAAEHEIREIVRWRRENQPGGANAGSVFTNPPGDSAGRLIETAGARGLRLGSAAVSTKHANFIQADEGGSAADVVALMAEVRRRVADETGARLAPETRLEGFAPEELGAMGLRRPDED